MSPSWQEALGWLEAGLEGKDPRRVVHALHGNIVLVLRTLGGETVRATIIMGRDAVRVIEGCDTDVEQPELMVRGPITGWRSYFETGDLQHASQLAFYGEPRLLETLSGLLAQNRSLWSVQFASPARRQ